ncbi:hypothetical protein JXB11_01370 [Candidatus Woesearchaeota archaeon]|nr:hypothetical protein [Candidatus Woesearchaeota archaeon]
MKKAQVATEAAILITIMTFFFIIFLLVASNRYVDISEGKRDELVLDLGYVIESEIDLAASTESGYYREIELPETLQGINYSIEFYNSTELKTNYSVVILRSLYWEDEGGWLQSYEHVINVPRNTFGTLCKGKNLIQRINLTTNLTCIEH